MQSEYSETKTQGTSSWRAEEPIRSRMDLGLNVYPERKKSKGTWHETATALKYTGALSVAEDNH